MKLLSAISGAGAGIAKKFAENKYKVALVSRRLEPLLSIEAEIKKAGGEAISVAADTGKARIVTAFLQLLIQSLVSESVATQATT